MRSESPETAEARLRDALAQCETRVNDCRAEFGSFEISLNGTLQNAGYLSPIAAIAVRRMAAGRWESITQEFRRLTAEVEKFIDGAVPVLSLISVGLAWNREVLPTVSGLAGTAKNFEANALPAWSGPAYEAYREKREAQGEAIAATGTIIQDIGLWLTDLADKNTAFLLSLIDPLIDLVKAIAEAAMEIATYIGLLEAIDTLAAAIANAAEAILDMEIKALQHAAGSLHEINEATAILNDNSYFPAGRWPQAVNRKLAH